jgi:hypothetical protein
MPSPPVLGGRRGLPAVLALLALSTAVAVVVAGALVTLRRPG